MALRSIYERFLATPNPLSLSEDASLHYITTLTTFTESGPVVRHLENQNKNIAKKKSEKILNAVEGSSSIALEVEATLEFISGGGAFLPGLENFITDRIVTFPMTHFVQFDAESKIKEIRISWDQGALLKQADVIGSRGKNWPICDGQDQLRLITRSAKAVTSVSAAAPVMESRGRDAEPAAVGTPVRSMSPNKKHIKDPHASLNLFEAPKHDENRGPSMPAAVAPRALARPAEREMSELFAAGHEDYEPSQQLGGSPKKEVKWNAVAPKGGASKKFQPSRLFDPEDEPGQPAGYKSDPSKYNHFDIGDNDENDSFQHRKAALPLAGAVPMRPKTNKHLSQWDFQDFVTPEKHALKIRSQDVRNYSWSDDEGENDETPGKHPGVPKPRRDNEPQFEFKDEPTPAPNRQAGLPKTAFLKKGASLYESRLYGDELLEEDSQKQPLGTITNNVGSRKDLVPHFSMTDTSPERKSNNENKSVGADVKKHIKMMSADWDNYDASPEQTKKPGAAGNLRKGQETHWGFTAGDEVPTVANGKKQGKNFWDF